MRKTNRAWPASSAGNWALKFEESVAFGDSLWDVALFQNLSHTRSVNGDKHIKDYDVKYHYTGNDLLEALNLVFF